MKEHRISVKHDIYLALLTLAEQVQRDRWRKGDFGRVHPAEILDKIARGTIPPLTVERSEPNHDDTSSNDNGHSLPLRE